MINIDRFFDFTTNICTTSSGRFQGLYLSGNNTIILPVGWMRCKQGFCSVLTICSELHCLTANSNTLNVMACQYGRSCHIIEGSLFAYSVLEHTHSLPMKSASRLCWYSYVSVYLELEHDNRALQNGQVPSLAWRLFLKTAWHEDMRILKGLCHISHDSWPTFCIHARQSLRHIGAWICQWRPSWHEA